MDTQASNSSNSMLLLRSQETANYLYSQVNDFAEYFVENQSDPIFSITQTNSQDGAPCQYTAIVDNPSHKAPSQKFDIECKSYVIEPSFETLAPYSQQGVPRYAQTSSSAYCERGDFAGSNFVVCPTNPLFENSEADFNNNFQNDLHIQSDVKPHAENFLQSSALQQCSTTNKIRLRDVPSNTAYAGTYGFQIFFEAMNDNRKAVPYTFSIACNKLYAQFSAVCPVNFKVDQWPPTPSIIRALAVYSSPQDVFDIVKRCANHETRDLDHVAPAHFIRCTDHRAAYHEDPQSGRHSVTVPFENPAEISEDPVVMYKFMCFNSCAGSLNRRPVQLIFTLEHNGRVIGRQVVELRICACPGRDLAKDEKQMDVTGKKRKSNKIENTTTITSVEPVAKRQKGNGPRLPAYDNSEVYTIQVKGRELYKLVQTIIHNYEMAQYFQPLHALAAENPRPTQTKQRLNDAAPSLGRSRGASAPSELIQEKRFTGTTPLATWFNFLELPQYTAIFKNAGLCRMEHLELISSECVRKLALNQSDFDRMYISLTRWRMANKIFSSQMSSLATPPSPGKALKISRTVVKHSYKINVNDEE